MSNNKRDREEKLQEESFPKVHVNWYPGHMLKTKKQIIEDLKLIDVVIELLDARIPVSSQNPDLRRITQNKKRIILLNKSDLADDNETKKWKEYFISQNIPCLIIDANVGKGIKEILKEVQTVLEEEIQKAESKGIQNKKIRLMIVGIPNVGKSSLINRLMNKKSQQVGNKPGVTKQKQWVRISNNIELLDTPGVLWPKFEDEKTAFNLSYIGSIKDEILPKEDIAYNLTKYLWNNYKNNIILRYKLTEEDIKSIMVQDENSMEDETVRLMNLIALKRGAIIRKGEVDYDKVSNIILTDFRTAKIGKITLEKCK